MALLYILHYIYMTQHLTHWGRMTHICVSKLTIVGSDNGLSPDRRKAIIWTNAGILSTVPLGTKLSEILIGIHIFSFKKMHLKMSSGKWWACCLGLNVLIYFLHEYSSHNRKYGMWNIHGYISKRREFPNLLALCCTTGYLIARKDTPGSACSIVLLIFHSY